MAIWEKLSEYIPSSKRGTSSASAPNAAADDVPEEELREDLELTAEPEGTTSFNRRNVMIGLGLVAVIFTGAFLYGINSASTVQKNKHQEATVEAADVSSEHLKSAPDDYGDSKNKRFDNREEDKTDKKRSQRVGRGEDNDIDLNERIKRPSPYSGSYAPAYTPVPQSSYRPSTQASAAPRSGSSGLTPEQKIELEKQKEKMAANKSDISFHLEKEAADVK